jgi:hypothetical protein
MNPTLDQLVRDFLENYALVRDAQCSLSVAEQLLRESREALEREGLEMTIERDLSAGLVCRPSFVRGGEKTP